MQNGQSEAAPGGRPAKAPLWWASPSDVPAALAADGPRLLPSRSPRTESRSP